MIELARRHWAASFALACLLHLLLAAILVLEGTDPMARGEGDGGLEVQLTRAGGSPAETAHTRNRIEDAVERAAAEAAARIEADEAARAAAPSEAADVAPPVVRDTSLAPAPESPVPPDVTAVDPASEELPDPAVATEPEAAPEAETAAAESAAPVTPDAEPVTAVPPTAAVTAQPVASPRTEVETPEAVRPEAASTAPPAADTRPALPVETAPLDTPSLPVTESAAPDAVAPASPPQEVLAGAPDAPVAAEAAPPPPDDLPPLESVSSVAPDAAAATGAAEAVQGSVAAEAAPTLPSAEAVSPEGPAAAQPATETEAAAVVAPETVRPARGAETVTRSGDAPENAGIVGPQESQAPGRGGAGGIETARPLDGTGEDRVERRGGRNYDRKLYTSVATAWLQLHRRYPEEAKEAELEGVALVYIVIDRNGDVRSFRLIQSTGSAILDKEIHDAIERARPFPVIPDTDHRDQVDLILPVKFELRQ